MTSFYSSEAHISFNHKPQVQVLHTKSQDKNECIEILSRNKQLKARQGQIIHYF